MRVLLDLLAPTVCVACTEPSDGDLCGACATRLIVCGEPRCERCGHPGSSESCRCGVLDGFGRARSLVAFAEPARSLVLAVKRRGARRTVGAIGGLLASLAEREWGGGAFDVITFVPGGRTTDEKGFDHARALASEVARRAGLPLRAAVRRAREGPRQADVSLADRASNVEGRFSCERARGRFLLVDDVLTTGATASACGRALLAAGASSVDVLTFARTIRRY
jgi:predicted amidophosphoribosyltransferase